MPSPRTPASAATSTEPSTPRRRSSRRRSSRRVAVALGLTALTAVTVAACSGSDKAASGPATTAKTATTGTVVGQNQPTNPFYQTPQPLPAGKPGDLIRSEPIPGAPSGSQAWRVLYHSTGVNGGDIAVSGVVIAPVGNAGTTASTAAGTTSAGNSGAGNTAPTAPGGTRGAGAGGRPVIAWAHPTSGVEDQCAPSYSSLVFELIPNLQAMLAAGYVVAATDYEGLGTAGVHPYLVGASEGRSVLDAARAASKIPDANAGTTIAAWGWSQGGQAALFAGQMAADYAPELRLAGVAAAAPAGDLSKIISADINTVDGVALGAYGVNAFADVYAQQYPGISSSSVLTPTGQQALPQIVALCDLTQSAQLEALVTPLIGKFYSTNPTTVSPWDKIFAENTPGAQRTPAPIMIVQGTADPVVPEASNAALAKTMCANGNKVNFKTYQGATHDTVPFVAAPDVNTFLADVLGGTTPSGLC